MTINEAQSKFPVINWLDYLNKTFYSVLTLDESVEILFVNSSYHKKYFQLIAQTPKRVQANYAHWCFLRTNFKELSNRIKGMENEFYREIRGSEPLISYRSTYNCVARMVDDMILPLGVFYVRKHYTGTNKIEYILNMVENIRTSTRKMFNDVSITIRFNYSN